MQFGMLLKLSVQTPVLLFPSKKGDCKDEYQNPLQFLHASSAGITGGAAVGWGACVGATQEPPLSHEDLRQSPLVEQAKSKPLLKTVSVVHELWDDTQDRVPEVDLKESPRAATHAAQVRRFEQNPVFWTCVDPAPLF
jgi:hypothetical protein